MITDKDLKDAMKSFEGHENPTSFPVNPDIGEAIWKTIKIVEGMGGTIHIAYGKKSYQVTVSAPPKVSNVGGDTPM